MYDYTMNNETTTGYLVEHLAKQEVNQIKKMVLGYGNFKKIASKSGLHLNTFRNIIDKGYGTPENVNKIRQNILSYTSKTAA